MPIDKVKPLKMESSATGGTETDFYPTETDPAEDYLATKGVSFEGLETFLIDKVGRTLVELFPTLYQSVTYSSGTPSAIDFFNSASFITANRVARYDFTYTSDNLTTEALKIYDNNGSTILRTYTWTHTYTGSDYQSSALVIT